MQTVPTVYMDRVNVGGAESGQQSNYNAKGAQATDNTWSIDGVPVTDTGDNIVRPEHASGASAFYYDFDSFQEMAITTGGADAKNPTSGVQLNMVLKSGGSGAHGSTRFYFENEALQDVNICLRSPRRWVTRPARAIGPTCTGTPGSSWADRCWRTSPGCGVRCPGTGLTLSR